MDSNIFTTQNQFPSFQTEIKNAEQNFFYNQAYNKNVVSPMNTVNGQLFGNPNDISDGIYFVKDFDSNKFVRSSFNPIYAPLMVYNSDCTKIFCPLHNNWENSSSCCFTVRNDMQFIKIKSSDPVAPYGLKISVHPTAKNFIELSYICFNPSSKTKMPFIVTREFGKLDKDFYDGYLNKGNQILRCTPRILNTDIPKEVLEVIVKIIDTNIKNKFGIKINYENIPFNEDLISALIAFPYEPSFYFMKDSLKEIKEIDPLNPNCFNILCRALNIKPWRTFRRLFNKNMAVLPVLNSLKRIGFKDINIINDFLSNEKVLKIFSNDDAPFALDSLAIIYEDSNTTFTMIENFIKVELERKSERSVLNMILRNIRSYDEKKLSDMVDAAQMFFINMDYMTEKEKEKILDEGLSLYNHNLLVNIQNTSDQYYDAMFNEKKVMQFDYSTDEKNLEDEIEGYKFILPEDSTRLHEIGSELNNCTRLYVGKIMAKSSLIVYVTHHGTKKMCIEVKKNSIVQCRVKNNKLPGEKELKILTLWADKKNLSCPKDSL